MNVEIIGSVDPLRNLLLHRVLFHGLPRDPSTSCITTDHSTKPPLILFQKKWNFRAINYVSSITISFVCVCVLRMCTDWFFKEVYASVALSARSLW